MADSDLRGDFQTEPARRTPPRADRANCCHGKRQQHGVTAALLSTTYTPMPGTATLQPQRGRPVPGRQTASGPHSHVRSELRLGPREVDNRKGKPGGENDSQRGTSRSGVPLPPLLFQNLYRASPPPPPPPAPGLQTGIPGPGPGEGARRREEGTESVSNSFRVTLL